MSDKDPSLGPDINAVCRLEGEFVLRSGAVSNVYFDKYRFEADPDLLNRVAAAMAPLIPEGADILAGLELGGIPIATALGLRTGLPVVFVRKAPKDYGTRQAIEGRDVSDRRVVIIEDVITSGGQVAASAGDLREAGAEVTTVICAIYRGEGDPHIDKLPDMPVHAALTRRDLV